MDFALCLRACAECITPDPTKDFRSQPLESGLAAAALPSLVPGCCSQTCLDFTASQCWKDLSLPCRRGCSRRRIAAAATEILAAATTRLGGIKALPFRCGRSRRRTAAAAAAAAASAAVLAAATTRTGGRKAGQLQQL